MNIVINGKNLQKRAINGQEVEKVIRNGVQIRPESVPPTVGPGIYWNESLGLISMGYLNRDDEFVWVTMADKNLGATTTFSSEKGYSQATIGNLYQRGNNYGFPFEHSSYPTTTTQIDSTGYGPGNYYSSSIIYNGSQYSPYTTINTNMWGGGTGTVLERQGPCPTGFHLLGHNRNTGGGESYQRTSGLYRLGIQEDGRYFFFPSNYNYGYCEYWTAEGHVSTWGSEERLYITEIDTQNNIFHVSSATPYLKTLNPIRPFKNNPVIPDSTRTILYQPS